MNLKHDSRGAGCVICGQSRLKRVHDHLATATEAREIRVLAAGLRHIDVMMACCGKDHTRLTCQLNAHAMSHACCLKEFEQTVSPQRYQHAAAIRAPEPLPIRRRLTNGAQRVRLGQPRFQRVIAKPNNLNPGPATRASIVSDSFLPSTHRLVYQIYRGWKSTFVRSRFAFLYI